VVRVAFALGCCDREVISHVATTGGITGEMVRDLMIESVERRFETVDLPHKVEWLSDNGSCYTARETITFAQDMGFITCFTPSEAPNPTAWPKPSSKPSSGITSASMIGPMQKR
jgi:putative transposase